jgi:hypothetical protein
MILAFIAGAGFSAFVVVWFMVKHDRRLDELTKALDWLWSAITLIRRRAVLSGGAGMGEGVDSRGE